MTVPRGSFLLVHLSRASAYWCIESCIILCTVVSLVVVGLCSSEVMQSGLLLLLKIDSCTRTHQLHPFFNRSFNKERKTICTMITTNTLYHLPMLMLQSILPRAHIIYFYSSLELLLTPRTHTSVLLFIY